MLFYLFLLGVFISLKFVLYFDSILKDKNKVMNPGLFSILLFALVSAYYIFWIRNTDDRWVFLWLPFIFFMIGEASVWIFSYIKKYNKIFAFILIACLLGYGAYSQATHADSLTKIKKDTYSQVRDAALWIKDNSSPGDVLVFPSTTQSTYYSERETISFYDEANLRSYTPAEFDKVIEKVKPKFIVISVFEPSVPQWTYTYPQVHNESFIPVNVWFADAEKKNPIIIIYEINYSIFRPTN